MAISSINQYEINTEEPINWIECEFTSENVRDKTLVENTIHFVPFLIRKKTNVDAIGSAIVERKKYLNIMGLYTSTKDCQPYKLLGGKRNESGDGFIEFDKTLTLKPGIYWGAEGINNVKTPGFVGLSSVDVLNPLFTKSLENVGKTGVGYYIEWNTTSSDELPEEINTENIKETDTTGSPYLLLRAVG